MPKIRIKQSPTGPSMFPDGVANKPNPFVTSGALQPVPRDQANIEAEKGESVLGDFDHDGNLEHMQIGGDSHANGGTPLNVPDNSFVFSDTKDMRLKGDLMKFFGKNPDNTKGYTPAEIAKQYDLNKYKATLDDPNADPISKRTAELMTQNYQEKLGQLAFMQEAHKGFPNGIPEVASDFAQSMLPHNPLEGQQPPQSQQPQQGYMPGSNQTFAFGGQYDDGGDYTVDPYHGGKSTTPTGKSNAYNGNTATDLQAWEKLIPGISQMDNKQAQSQMYDYMLKNNPDQVKQMWASYGLTNQGSSNTTLKGMTDNGKFKPNVLDNVDNLQQLKSAYVDGMFGVRQFDPNAKPTTTQNTPQNINYSNPFADNKPATPSAPSGSPAQPAAAPIPNDYKVPSPISFTGENGNYGNLTPDVWSVNSAMEQRATLKKYLPYIATPDFNAANPTFYDPTRELTANEEMQNSQMMVNDAFGNPQAARVAASANSGQGAAAAANTIGKYDNMNVGVANQFSEQDAAEMNQYAQLRAKNETDLYNGNVIANQQFDNAKREADDNVLKARINEWNNRSQFEAMNKTNRMYSIDPTTGDMTFTPTGRDVLTGSGQQQHGYTMDNYPNLMQSMLAKGMTHDEAHKVVMGMIEGEHETQTYKGVSNTPATTRFSGYQYPAEQ